MYRWPLGSVTLPMLHPELPSVHSTRLELMAGAVTEALRDAGPRALDLGCNEGWFCHRLLEWGAAEVVGVDVRPQNLRRAALLRDHFGIPAERLQLVQADVFEATPQRLGRFDVVLLLGLVYHLEDPIGAMRRAAALTRRLCVIESQLTRQTAPIEFGWGTKGSSMSSASSFAMLVEHDREVNPLAAPEGRASLIPNRAALELAARVAGFARVEVQAPRPSHNSQYVAGERAVLLAWPDPVMPDAERQSAEIPVPAARLGAAARDLAEVRAELGAARSRLAELDRQLGVLSRSLSWRVTAPLRAGARLARALAARRRGAR
jgi:SAM-dependent methyltransferase